MVVKVIKKMEGQNWWIIFKYNIYVASIRIIRIRIIKIENHICIIFFFEYLNTNDQFNFSDTNWIWSDIIIFYV
jgi:hypothetical protein